jgi:PEGA domain-containing protein
MRPSAAAFLVLVLSTLGGCVERRMVVTSDPPGALVLHNGQPIGNAPADDHFIFYGIHHFTLIRPGYQTLQVDQRIRAPWYQFFPLDMVSEILLPFQIEDVRRFTYQMQPVPGVRPEEVSDRANVLRTRGKEIAEPSADAGRRSGLPPAPPRNAPALPAPRTQPGSVPPVGAPVPPAQPPAPIVPPASPPPFIGGGALGTPDISGPG